MVKLDFWLARCHGLDKKTLTKKKVQGTIMFLKEER
jgi:hypothetical protein